MISRFADLGVGREDEDVPRKGDCEGNCGN